MQPYMMGHLPLKKQMPVAFLGLADDISGATHPPAANHSSPSIPGMTFSVARKNSILHGHIRSIPPLSHQFIS